MSSMGQSSTFNVFSLLLLSSLFISATSSRPRAPLSKVYDLSPGTSPRFPQGQAECLIKSLGLLPGAAEESAGPVLGPGVHERRIHLKVEGESGASVSPQDLGQYAGYYKLKRTHGANMFYLFFESRSNKTSNPLVLWITGGPGCAGELALFYENGPFQIVDNVETLNLVWNEFGWDKEANIIFVDQPIGAGYSYSTDPRDIHHDEEGVSEDMYGFLQAFFETHPEYAKNDFFVTGESYAGYYVPEVTARLHEANKKKEGIPINLKGFAIGNGFTQPDIQYKAYADYALDMGLIAKTDHKRLSKLFPACSQSIRNCGSKGTVTCVAAYLVCQSIFNHILSLAGNVNYYDVRKECDGDLCYDFSNLEIYLNYSDVREALGVGNRKFLSCSPLVYEAMIVDWMKNLERGIPALLEDGIQMLVYAGEYDLIGNWLVSAVCGGGAFYYGEVKCIHVINADSTMGRTSNLSLLLSRGKDQISSGNSRWVSAMNWSGQSKYAKAPWRRFVVDGKEAGLVTGYRNLNFVKIHDAGHMVPMDQPKNALEMLRRWTRGIPLGTQVSRATMEPKRTQYISAFSS